MGLWDALQGKKTLIVCGAYVAVVVGEAVGLIPSPIAEVVKGLLVPAGAAALRSAIRKAELL